MVQEKQPVTTTSARVLVVEDESIIRMDIENALKRAGHAVVASCASGEEAIELCAEHKPEVVLMDIALNGPLSGIDAAHVIHETAGSAVIFLTANSDVATVNRARTAMPYGYVIKPFRPVDLSVAIEMAVHNHVQDKRVRRERDDLKMRLMGEGDQSALFITVKGRQQRILCRDIRFIQALKDYVGIQVQGRRHVVYSTMASMEQRLPKDKFLRDQRAFSHGCVRLSEPLRLAKYLLRNDSAWTPERINTAMNAKTETTVRLKKPVPVVLGYFTAWVDRDGIVSFRRDVYGHDARLAAELFAGEGGAQASVR